jgi:hypothetical protein
MKWIRRLALASALWALWAGAAAAGFAVDFEDAGVGAPPSSWTIAATNGGERPAQWAVEEGGGPDGPGKFLSLVEPEGAGLLARFTVGGVFNLVWMPETRVRDLDASISIRANHGNIDQGGGLIWRMRDAGNYYVARYNPLERNLRLYFVRDGARVQLASAEGLPVGIGEWFTIRVVHIGAAIEVYLNGQKRLEMNDATFGDAGGIGVWTKADAATSFDDLVVNEL